MQRIPGRAGRQPVSEGAVGPGVFVVKTDASAAREVVQRQGSGRIEHLSVKQLWVQERESNKELDLQKIPRAPNWADLMTHHWSEGEAAIMLSGMSVDRRGPSG